MSCKLCSLQRTDDPLLAYKIIIECILELNHWINSKSQLGKCCFNTSVRGREGHIVFSCWRQLLQLGFLLSTHCWPVCLANHLIW